jgi:hypothetical protein
METLTEQIRSSYSLLRQAMEKAHLKSELVFARKAIFARQKAATLAKTDPKELGANEAAREAKLTEIHIDAYVALQEAEEQDRDARHSLQIASLVVEEARAHLRIAEVEVHRGDKR